MFRMDGSGQDAKIRLIDRSYVTKLSEQVRGILAQRPEGKMFVDDFVQEFKKRLG